MWELQKLFKIHHYLFPIMVTFKIFLEIVVDYFVSKGKDYMNGKISIWKIHCFLLLPPKKDKENILQLEVHEISTDICTGKTYLSVKNVVVHYQRILPKRLIHCMMSPNDDDIVHTTCIWEWYISVLCNWFKIAFHFLKGTLHPSSTIYQMFQLILIHLYKEMMVAQLLYLSILFRT